jgi:hypothetical protein
MRLMVEGKRVKSMVVLALAAIGTPGLVQEMPASAPAPCPATPAPLPAELAGWASPAAVTAAGQTSALAAARLQIGKRADVTLLPTPQIAYAVRPEHPGGTVSSGGMLGFTIAKAGTYRIALGSGAWIDVVSGDKAVMSTAHARGPACTGVRKMVDFQLTPGDYVLEVAGNGEPALSLMVTPLP